MILVSGNETNFNLKTVTVLLIIVTVWLAGELRKKLLQFSVNLAYGNINKSCRSLQKKINKRDESSLTTSFSQVDIFDILALHLEDPDPEVQHTALQLIQVGKKGIFFVFGKRQDLNNSNLSDHYYLVVVLRALYPRPSCIF